MMNLIEVVIPSYKSELMITSIIKSMEKYRPDNLELLYHVVENSDVTHYKDKVLSLSDNVKWYNNPSADTGEDATNNKGSWANCSAIEFVLDSLTSEYTFLCHNDCLVVSEDFFTDALAKIKQGYSMVGTSIFPNEVAALHIAGFFVKTEILKKVGVKPQFDKGMDVGDVLTDYCRKESLSLFCFSNTLNNKELVELCDEPWRGLGPKCGIDRALNVGLSKVVYVHLGRGTMKRFGKYHKQGKVYYSDWESLCEFVVGDQ